jgi:hypothetical protein
MNEKVLKRAMQVTMILLAIVLTLFGFFIGYRIDYIISGGLIIFGATIPQKLYISSKALRVIFGVISAGVVDILMLSTLIKDVIPRIREESSEDVK